MDLERAAGFIKGIGPGNSPTKEATGTIHGERYQRELKLREFGDPESLNELPKSEKRAFSQLVRATRRWAQVYQIQEGPDIRAHFYPPRVTENQVRRAAEENPEILSPYTVVLKNLDGSFSTIPMHEAYSSIIERTNVLGLLDKAAKTTKDKNLRDYLRAKVKAIKTGSWEEAERIWLEREDEPDLDIVIGFYDTYTDKFLAVKYAAEAWTGVLKRHETKELQPFVDAFLDNWSERTGVVRPKIKVRVDDTSVKSGQAGREDLKWTANNLPNQIDLRRKFGSKFTIFWPTFNDLYEARANAFDQYIHPSRRSGIPKTLIKTGILRRVSAHEIGHSLIPEGIERRIGAHKNWFNELNCDLISLDGYFDIPEVYTHNREHEVAFATHFANGFLHNEEYKRTGKMNDYFPSHAIILSACLESGAVQAVDGCLVWKDVAGVRRTIRELATEVIRLANEASEKDIEQFRNLRLDENVYEKVLQTAA